MTSGNAKPSKANPLSKNAEDGRACDAAVAIEGEAEGDGDAARARKPKRAPKAPAERQATGEEAPRRAAPAPYDVEDEAFDVENEPAEDPNVGRLELKISRALWHKMKHQAREEGITLDEFAIELLSEGVVLRAWEIVEKKNQLRGGNVGQGPALPNRQGHPNMRPNHGNHNHNHNHNNHNGHGHNRKNGGGNRSGMSQSRYQSIMDDKATFLEYVRNQERNRR